jgi:acyl-coenzyme A synthetase/AMP-(fatty) acid ligase
MGVAFVIPRVGQRPLESELIAFARDNLASFKVPQHVIFVDAFPLTSGTDKVQKYKLREMASETLGVALKRAGAR